MQILPEALLYNTSINPKEQSPVHSCYVYSTDIISQHQSSTSVTRLALCTSGDWNHSPSAHCLRPQEAPQARPPSRATRQLFRPSSARPSSACDAAAEPHPARPTRPSSGHVSPTQPYVVDTHPCAFTRHILSPSPVHPQSHLCCKSRRTSWHVVL